MPTKLVWGIIAVAIAVVTAAAGVFAYMAWVPGANGKLAVAVHDAPCSECAHVWVTFSSVSVHADNATGGGWTTLNVSGATVDLMALNGTAMAKVIGVSSLKAGHYEQVRLDVTNVTVALTNGTTIVAHVPNASSADVNGAFNITSGATTTISIDIDLQSSLHVVMQGPIAVATFTPNIGSVVVE